MIEGVIKFRALHQRGELSRRQYGEVSRTLRSWRKILFGLELVGRDPARYDGAGYGNLSARVSAPSSRRGSRSFLISGTQTGGMSELGHDELCLVSHYDVRLNQVRSEGPILPSSESLTHGAIYDLSPVIRFVFHVHSPVLWTARRELRLPTTPSEVGYGTPDMARAVQHLFQTTHLSDSGVLAMGGHEDGVIAFGHTPEDAGNRLLGQYAAAIERNLN